MGFADTLAELAYTPPVSRCTVRQWAEKLSESDAAEFEAALASDLPTIAIYGAMRVMGFERRDGTLARHRRQECTCELR